MWKGVTLFKIALLFVRILEWFSGKALDVNAEGPIFSLQYLFFKGSQVVDILEDICLS